MYREIDDFIKDWKYETESTLKIYALITEDTRSEKINENVRSLERLAWHLTQTISEMGQKAGLFEQDDLEHQPIPAIIADLAAIYNQKSLALGQAVVKKWTNSSLNEKVPMYGDEWQKGQILRILISHQSHHRGQMTVIMRMLGLPVPGLYGPSKEEWVQMGIPAMD
jgi:uncharacterized damage-inducible protein DinB